MKDKLRIAIAASGSGTCFQSVIDNIRQGRLDAEIVQLITDQPGCLAAGRAREYGIPVLAVEVPEVDIRLPDDTRLSKKESKLAARVIHEDRILRGYDGMPGMLSAAPDHLVMLGYMRVLSEYLVGACRAENMKLWNTHPAPIPEYRGENGYAWGVGDDKQAVRRNGWHCVSFHDVTDAKFDTGRVLSCSPLEVRADETEESLKERGMRREYEQIRQCLQWLAEGRVKSVDGMLNILDADSRGFRDLMRLHDYFAVSSNELYSIAVSTTANDEQRALSAPVDVDVQVCYTPEGKTKPKMEGWKVKGVPYNLAFTYARDAVNMLREDGLEASLMFDDIEIHPVIMKKDLKKRQEQGGKYDG